LGRSAWQRQHTVLSSGFQVLQLGQFMDAGSESDSLPYIVS
jgi:hypothetical protein